MPTSYMASVADTMQRGAETLSRLHEALHVVRARIEFSHKAMSESRRVLARANERIDQQRRASLTSGTQG